MDNLYELSETSVLCGARGWFLAEDGQTIEMTNYRSRHAIPAWIGERVPKTVVGYTEDPRIVVVFLRDGTLPAETMQ